MAEARKLQGTDATAQTGAEPAPAGASEIGKPGQRAASGAAELAREREGDAAAGRAAGDRSGEGRAGNAGTPSYGGSGQEGLGSEGTTSGRASEPKAP